MFGIGIKELIIIAVILLILFGSKRIPEFTRDLVQAIRNLGGAFKSDDANKRK
jgi:TatA/E family protein of Tat protein translocase